MGSGMISHSSLCFSSSLTNVDFPAAAEDGRSSLGVQVRLVVLVKGSCEVCEGGCRQRARGVSGAELHGAPGRGWRRAVWSDCTVLGAGS